MSWRICIWILLIKVPFKIYILLIGNLTFLPYNRLLFELQKEEEEEEID